MAKQNLPITRYKGEIQRPRIPFWLPAPNYYVLAVATATGVFFLVWGILQDGGEPTPWIAAGVFSSGVLGAAVLLREVILRSARKRFQANQRRLDRSLYAFYGDINRPARAEKLTLEKNAWILREVKKKSEAVKILGKYAEGHREVIEMCRDYIEAVERELPTVGSGSPRIIALHRGRDAARDMHHFHMLKWAEHESRTLTQEANRSARAAERIESARKAVEVIDSALAAYPHDAELIESKTALDEFLISLRVTHLLEKAEKADLKQNHIRSLKHYRDALSLLEKGSSGAPEASYTAERIENEIARLTSLLPEIVRTRAGNKNNN